MQYARWWVMVAFVASLAASAQGQCQPEWLYDAYSPGTSSGNQKVRCMTVWDRDGAGPIAPVVAVGGDFSGMGEASFFGGSNPVARRLALWSGSGWTDPSTSSTAFPGHLGGEIWTAIPYGNDLVVGGDTAPYLGRYNGATWSPIGVGPNGSVLCAVQFGSDLVVAGNFSQAGGAPASRIARWNGSAWSPMGSGFNNYVRSLAVLNNELYATGDFSQSGASPVSRVARWTGSSWVSVGSLPTITFGTSLAVFESSLWMCGIINLSGAGGSVYQWNGTAWQLRGSFAPSVGTFSGPYSLAVMNNQLYVGGSLADSGSPPIRNIAVWNGTVFDRIYAGGADMDVYAMAYFDQKYLFGGGFNSVGTGQTAYSVAELDPFAGIDQRAWAPLRSRIRPSNVGIPVVRDMLASPERLLVAGHFKNVGAVQTAPIGNHQGSVAAWDGRFWSSLGAGVPLVEVLSLAQRGTTIFAAGAGSPFSVYRWDGTMWSPVSGGGGPLNVKEMLATPTQLYATSSDGVWVHNGTSWSPVGGFSTGTVESIAIHNGVLYAGGFFTSIGGTPAGYIARFDAQASAWVAVGSGFNAPVYRLFSDGASLFAGGAFSMAGAVNVGRFARWDGSSWSQVGQGFTGTGVARIGTHAGQLVVSGINLTPVGGSVGGAVYAWNGSQWNPLGNGNGFDDSVDAFATFQGQLCVGGRFKFIRTSSGSWINRPYFARLYTGLPFFRVQPADNQACAGGFASFFVNVQSTFNPQYQWRKNGTPLVDDGRIVGAQSSSLSISNLNANDAGLYDCVATNLCGSLASSGAQLSIQNGAAILTQPNPVTVCIDGSGAMSVSAPGATGFQWQVQDNAARGGWRNLSDGTLVIDGYVLGVISGASTPTMTRTGAQGGWTHPVHVREFRCVASSQCGSSTSNPSMMTMCFANCDCSTTTPVLNVQDFSCFLNRFAAGDPSANCDGSTSQPTLNVQDFACFLNRFATGCP